MTKQEIDSYFTANIKQITEAINKHRTKCVTANVIDITTDIYLICVDSASRIKPNKLEQFIGSVARNIYKFSNSSLNYKDNRVFANDNQYPPIYEEEEIGLDVQIQNMEYVFAKYLAEAKPSEKYFFDLYVNQGVRSVRKIRDRLNISHHGAWVLINDFKSKMKEYERQAEITE